MTRFVLAVSIAAALAGFMVKFRDPRFLIALLGVVTIPILVNKPVIVASAVTAFSFINPSLLPPIAEFSEFTVRWQDIVTLMLCLILFLRACILGHLSGLKECRNIFDPILMLIGYIGFSLLWVWLKTPELFGVSLASFLRLVVTVFGGWLIFLSVSKERDLRLLEHLFLAGLIGTLVIGLWEGIKMGLFTKRYGGVLGANSFGIVSGLLVLYGWLKWRENSHVTRFSFVALSLFALGLVGLVASKSASSILATVVSAILAWGRRRGILSFTSHQFLRKVILGVALVVLALIVIWGLRRTDVEGLLRLTGGSFAQRLVIAYSALSIFSRDPLLGTGWQASGTHFYISDPDLNSALMSAFPNLPQHYFFIEKPTSLHNMYLQLLTELGIIGFCIFIFIIVRLYKTFKKWLPDIHRFLPQQSMWARFACAGLIFLLVWWNTNPLYGGQTESLLAVFFLSMLASIRRLSQKCIKDQVNEISSR